MSDRFKNHEKQLFIWAIPIYIELILMAVNIFYPLLYSYQDGSYNRGPLFNLLYLFAYVYVLIAAADAFRASLREENFADTGTLRAYAAFPVAPAVAGLVQYFWPSIPILCICLVFIIEFIFMKTSHTLISIDNLTQLNNRRHFLQKLQQNMNDSAPGYEIYLFMMDVDSFKKINDTFGHGEGDAALVMLADILKKAAGKSGSQTVIGRYGGDEFMAFVRSADREEPEKFSSRIIEELNQANKESKKPFQLKISIGIARLEEGMTILQLLEAADQQLYEVKSEHHAKQA